MLKDVVFTCFIVLLLTVDLEEGNVESQGKKRQ